MHNTQNNSRGPPRLKALSKSIQQVLVWRPTSAHSPLGARFHEFNTGIEIEVLVWRLTSAYNGPLWKFQELNTGITTESLYGGSPQYIGVKNSRFQELNTGIEMKSWAAHLNAWRNNVRRCQEVGGGSTEVEQQSSGMAAYLNPFHICYKFQESPGLAAHLNILVSRTVDFKRFNTGSITKSWSRCSLRGIVTGYDYHIQEVQHRDRNEVLIWQLTSTHSAYSSQISRGIKMKSWSGCLLRGIVTGYDYYIQGHMSKFSTGIEMKSWSGSSPPPIGSHCRLEFQEVQHRNKNEVLVWLLAPRHRHWT
ncbi:hypothetical protein B0H16DRAFT_1469934 [Mycena metata]|uniref:Uncharacterized protein n=1 Tax=Mycena metata TaxID=1033252 RepID=A0AAD7MSD0_9AGAR|nr:hypothetical protein B0H16DRAFT_1469934 [Mycena metata]